MQLLFSIIVVEQPTPQEMTNGIKYPEINKVTNVTF